MVVVVVVVVVIHKLTLPSIYYTEAKMGSIPNLANSEHTWSIESPLSLSPLYFDVVFFPPPPIGDLAEGMAPFAAIFPSFSVGPSGRRLLPSEEEQ